MSTEDNKQENGTQINCVSGYLKWVEDLESTSCAKKFYRGQADKDWHISAGVFRRNISETYEHDLLQHSNLLLWNELSKYTSCLEKLVFLQHYGMQTRLLDVTFNPLVALFFACMSQEGNDGIVYYGFETGYVQRNDQVAELTAEYPFKFRGEISYDNVETYAKRKGLQVWEFFKPILVYPPINNPRIEHQRGAFIMTPLTHNIKENSDSNASDTRNCLRNCFQNDHVAIIPAGSKKKILEELSNLGIDEGSMFQSVVDKIKAIKQNIERRPLNNITYNTQIK